MVKRKKGVHSIKSRTKVTHVKLEREKIEADKIRSYRKKTGISKPVCSQKRTRRNVVSGPSKGNDVSQNCSPNIVAAHVSISSKAGVFIIPMCNNHNDSGGWGNVAPFPGDTVIVNGCRAVRVPDDTGHKTKTSKKSTNTKVRKLTKVQTWRNAKNRPQKTWSWEGVRMGKISDYKYSAKTRRLSKK